MVQVHAQQQRDRLTGGKFVMHPHGRSLRITFLLAKQAETSDAVPLFRKMAGSFSPSDPKSLTIFDFHDSTISIRKSQ
jgi:hypothetical protein